MFFSGSPARITIWRHVTAQTYPFEKRRALGAQERTKDEVNTIFQHRPKNHNFSQRPTISIYIHSKQRHLDSEPISASSCIILNTLLIPPRSWQSPPPSPSPIPPAFATTPCSRPRVPSLTIRRIRVPEQMLLHNSQTCRRCIRSGYIDLHPCPNCWRNISQSPGLTACHPSFSPRVHKTSNTPSQYPGKFN